MNSKPKLYKYHGLFVRNKGDEGVVKQQVEYLAAKGKVENPIVLDLGGYIGTFVQFAVNELGAKKVFSFEPDPNSCEVFLENWRGDERVSLTEAAVAREDGIAELFLGKTYPSCNSLTSFRGRDTISANVIGFKKVFDEVKPDIIKCDIEGGEFSIDWSQTPKETKIIIMELHQNKPEWLQEGKKLDELLQSMGFVQLLKLNHEKKAFRGNQIAIWERKGIK